MTRRALAVVLFVLMAPAAPAQPAGDSSDFWPRMGRAPRESVDVPWNAPSTSADPESIALLLGRDTAWDAPIIRIDLSVDGRYLAGLTNAGDALVYSLPDRLPYAVPCSGTRAARFDASRPGVLLCAGEGAGLTATDLGTGEQRPLVSHTTPDRIAALDARAGHVASVDARGRLVVTRTADAAWRFEGETHGPPYDVVLSPDARHLALVQAVSSTESMEMWSIFDLTTPNGPPGKAIHTGALPPEGARRSLLIPTVGRRIAWRDDTHVEFHGERGTRVAIALTDGGRNETMDAAAESPVASAGDLFLSTDFNGAVTLRRTLPAGVELGADLPEREGVKLADIATDGRTAALLHTNSGDVDLVDLASMTHFGRVGGTCAPKGTLVEDVFTADLSPGSTVAWRLSTATAAWTRVTPAVERPEGVDAPPPWLLLGAGCRWAITREATLVRHDDGRLLLRREAEPPYRVRWVPPTAPGPLTGYLKLDGVEGEPAVAGVSPGAIMLRVVAVGAAQNVVRVQASGPLPAGLALFPDAPQVRVNVGERAEVRAGFSSDAAGPADVTLPLEVVTAQGARISAAVRVHVRSPKLEFGAPRIEGQSLLFTVTNTGDAPTGELGVGVTLAGEATPLPVSGSGGLAAGASTTVSIALPAEPEDTVTLTLWARTPAFPGPVWQTGPIEVAPQSVVLAFFKRNAEAFGALLGTSLVFALGVWALFAVRRWLLRRIQDGHLDPQTMPLSLLPDLDWKLRLTRLLSPVLVRRGITRERWARVVDAGRQSQNTLSAVAYALGAAVGEVLSTTPDVRRITLPPMRLRFPRQAVFACLRGERAGTDEARTLARLAAAGGPGLSTVVVIDRTEAGNAREVLGNVTGLLPVVIDDAGLRGLLLRSDALSLFKDMLSRQLPRSELSPYRVAGGVEEDALFFGRERELRLITDRGARNLFIVAARQMGKSSLLKAAQRRLLAGGGADVHLVTLAASPLPQEMARVLGVPPPAEGDADAFRVLAAGTPERPRIWLVDEADRFVAGETARNFEHLWVMRALAEERRAYFVMTGFWDLYAAAVLTQNHPLRNFAERIRLGPLERDAARALCREPMADLGLHFDAEATMDTLIDAVGGRPNLLVLGLKDLVERMPRDAPEVKVDAAMVRETLARCEDLREELKGWRDAGAGAASRLHRAALFGALDLESPTADALARHLRDLGFEFDSETLTRTLERLELAYVLVRDAEERLHVPVPLLVERILRERGPAAEWADTERRAAARTERTAGPDETRLPDVMPED